MLPFFFSFFLSIIISFSPFYRVAEAYIEENRREYPPLPPLNEIQILRAESFEKVHFAVGLNFVSHETTNGIY